MAGVETVHGDEQELGLRERKKQRTRETIARVALELFGEHGFHETTIKQIADAADVSPRTVSAYFPVKEELVFSDTDEAFNSLAARLASRAPGETVADGIRDWIREFIDASDDDIERRRCMRQVIESDPALRTYERGLQERVERLIATAVAVVLQLEPDDLLPKMVGAATLAALDSLGHETKRQRPGTLPTEGVALLDDAMAFIGGGISALVVRRGVGAGADASSLA
jgi:AcrR family transcriptional regulator